MKLIRRNRNAYFAVDSLEANHCVEGSPVSHAVSVDRAGLAVDARLAPFAVEVLFPLARAEIGCRRARGEGVAPSGKEAGSRPWRSGS